MSLLILVVDDEPDVEALFRQQFRRDLRAGRFVDGFRAVRGRGAGAIAEAEGGDAHPDPLRHQHAGHERARAAAKGEGRCAPTCRSS